MSHQVLPATPSRARSYQESLSAVRETTQGDPYPRIEGREVCVRMCTRVENGIQEVRKLKQSSLRPFFTGITAPFTPSATSLLICQAYEAWSTFCPYPPLQAPATSSASIRGLLVQRAKSHTARDLPRTLTVWKCLQGPTTSKYSHLPDSEHSAISLMAGSLVS